MEKYLHPSSKSIYKMYDLFAINNHTNFSNRFKNSSISFGHYYSYCKNYSDNQSTIRDLTRMEKILAEHMVNSKKTSPHVQSFIEIDVTNLWDWREGVKNDF